MFNLDAIKQKKNDITNALAKSIRDNDENAMQQAMTEFQNFMSDQIMAEAHGVLDVTDSGILAGRGVRQLTSKETKFYQTVIDNAQQATNITSISEAFPETIIDTVVNDIRTTHPLLDAVNFQNTTALTKIIRNTKGAQTAAWGAIGSAMAKELEGSIDALSLTICKLTAYMFITKDMLDLGPAWVDKYIRETLMEALATELETAIVDGTGKDQPIGMSRDISDDVTVTAGVYPRKSAVSVNRFDVETYGTLLSTISKDNTGKHRAVAGVILVVNPTDYFTKVMPATTLKTTTGQYINDVFPFPTQVIQSVGVPTGHAIIGIADKYFMGVGSSKDGKLEYDDSYKFVEDLRTYTIKLYGNGRANDNNAFVYLDISALVPDYPIVLTSPHENADLVALSVGSLTLTPAFDRDTTSYTATATAASNTIAATAKDGDATIVIKNGTTTVTNGGSASWTDNAVNTVTATVTNGSEAKTYTIAVTKGTPA